MSARSLRLVSQPAPAPVDRDGPALARVAAGDMGALGEVYDRHAQTIFRFAARAVGPEDAQDVMQTTFLRVAKLAHTYDNRGTNARAWLFGIAVRVLRERRRSLFRFGRALMRLGESASDIDARDPGARADLERGLRNLSDTKRVALILAEVEGFSGEEIAQMLDVPIGTVWTRLHHARKELRAFCGEEP